MTLVESTLSPGAGPRPRRSGASIYRELLRVPVAELPVPGSREAMERVCAAAADVRPYDPNSGDFGPAGRQ